MSGTDASITTNHAGTTRMRSCGATEGAWDVKLNPATFHEAADLRSDHTPELMELAAELGLEANVLFPGVISEEELQRLYAEAAVYVYPAPQEDFGMGVIEAMACGIPVVAWDQAGPTVTVAAGETGRLAAPEDIEDYAAGILAYLGDRALNSATGRRAHLRAGLFAWDRHVDTLAAAVRAVAGAAEPAAAAPAVELLPVSAG